MINQDGFRMLDSFSSEKTCFAIFLLASFDLTSFVALHPEKLIKFGINKGFGIPRTEDNLIAKIDELVSDGFLEYGPFVTGWRKKKTPTVRLRQRLLLSRRQITVTAMRVRARQEREALIESS